jgi:hypothetical protein
MAGTYPFGYIGPLYGLDLNNANKLNSIPIDPSTPSNNAVLQYNSTTQTYEPRSSVVFDDIEQTNPVYNFIECGRTGPQTLANYAVASIVNWAITNQLGSAIVKADVVDPLDNAYDFIVLEDGIYSVECTMSFQAGGGQRGSIIYIQGGNKGHELDNNTGFENTRIQVSARDFMQAGDRIRIAAFQNSGGNLDVLSGGLNRLTIFKEQ